MTVAHILSTLSSSEIVETIDVLYFSIEPNVQTIRALLKRIRSFRNREHWKRLEKLLLSFTEKQRVYRSLG